MSGYSIACKVNKRKIDEKKSKLIAVMWKENKLKSATERFLLYTTRKKHWNQIFQERPGDPETEKIKDSDESYETDKEICLYRKIKVERETI